jgi:hypothetical protein
MSPPSHWPLAGRACMACSVVPMARRRARGGAPRPSPLSPALCLDIRSGSAPYGERHGRWTCAAPPPSLRLPGERMPFSRLFAEDGTRGQRSFSVAEPTLRRLCTRRHRGERTSIRVWCSHVGALVDGNKARTRCQGRMTLGLNPSGKNLAKIRS